MYKQHIYSTIHINIAITVKKNCLAHLNLSYAICVSSELPSEVCCLESVP